MVCHDMEVVADFASRVIVMAKGGVVADGPTFDVLRRPDVLRQASLMPSQIVDIALRLSCDDTLAKCPGFAQVCAANTLDEMVAALEAASFRGAREQSGANACLEAARTPENGASAEKEGVQ